MDEQAKAAAATASDSVKQLITLATALLGFQVTFAKDFITHLPPDARSAAGWSWLCLLLSVACGIWTLLALTGSLARSETFTSGHLNKLNVRFPTSIQIALFLSGLVLTCVAGYPAISNPGAFSAPDKTSPCACQATLDTAAKATQPPNQHFPATASTSVVPTSPASVSAASTTQNKDR